MKAHFHGGRQGSGKLCGMMSEIIGYHNAAWISQHLEPAVNPGKGMQAFSDIFRADSQSVGGCGCGKSIAASTDPFRR